MGLGLVEPATEPFVDKVLDFFRQEQINRLDVHHLPHRQPDQFPEWLQARYLRVKSSWGRIYRAHEPLAKQPSIDGCPWKESRRKRPLSGRLWLFVELCLR